MVCGYGRNKDRVGVLGCGWKFTEIPIYQYLTAIGSSMARFLYQVHPKELDCNFQFLMLAVVTRMVELRFIAG